MTAPRTWKTPGGATVHEEPGGYRVTPAPLARTGVSDLVHRPCSPGWRLTPADPLPDLRTADQITADREGQLEARIAGLETCVAELMDTVHGMANQMQALLLDYELRSGGGQ